ncbi:MAG: Flp family type IVb pilin [Roseovarius sp.]|jgi:pilus assembly protein Flp/PilA|uniref:Flp family type IVb pilin n=1 Tax=Roseovarius sp. TaxID=1486281 RepID=UPI0032EEBEE7
MTFARKTLRFVARTVSMDDEGATAIEYGLFAALVGAVIVGTVATLGGQTNEGFSQMSTALSDAGIEDTSE